jgi:hypothetical protein
METAETLPEDVEYDEEERTAWYTPGLYRRIGIRRRPRAERPKRLSIRHRLQARGLHWNSELVVGVFVAVLVASLLTVGAIRVGAGRTNDFGSASNHSAGGGANGGTAGGASGNTAGGGAGVTGGGYIDFPTPTAPCIAAPIPGSPLRPCTY